MLSNFFASRREMKRLAEDVKYHRGRAEAYEKKADYWQGLVLERDMLMVDRFLTASVKTYAVADEAKHHVKPEADTEYEDGKKELQSAFLRQCYDDAKAAGKTEAEAEELYRQRLPSIIAEYDAQFNNE